LNIDDLTILKKASKEIEKREGQTKARYSNNTASDTERLSAQAYELFSHGKTPVQVAIELNLRKLQVTKYYREYWKLKGLYKLNMVYEEIKDDIPYFLKLRRVSKVAGMSTEQVVNLLEIANNDLPALENSYEKLKTDLSSLENRKLYSKMTLHSLGSQIMASSQMLSSCRISCQEEQRKMVNLHREEIRLKKLVREFKNNDEEYLKIKKTVEKAVTNILFDAKGILRLSLFSLIESMRTDPQGYCNLIHYNRSSSAGNIDQHNAGQYIHGQQPYLSYDDGHLVLFEVANTLIFSNSRAYVTSIFQIVVGVYSTSNNLVLVIHDHCLFFRIIPI
jgi:hypothetical protein